MEKRQETRQEYYKIANEYVKLSRNILARVVDTEEDRNLLVYLITINKEINTLEGHGPFIISLYGKGKTGKKLLIDEVLGRTRGCMDHITSKMDPESYKDGCICLFSPFTRHLGPSETIESRVEDEFAQLYERVYNKRCVIICHSQYSLSPNVRRILKNIPIFQIKCSKENEEYPSDYDDF